MFLSKKNAIYFNKPKTNDPQKPKRILGGWQDDENQNQQKIDYTKRSQIQPKISLPNLLEGDDMTEIPSPVKSVNDKKQIKQVYYLDWDQLDARSDIQCEKKLIQEIVLPGGIRIKPSDTQLLQFLKQSKGMETHVVGSLLLSKIQVNYPFPIKAKALYTIEFMVKKNQKYAAYFKAQSQKLKQFPQPEDNIQNYRKILKQTLNTIGINQANKAAQNEPQLTFVDPGYNDQPSKKNSTMKAFISESTKKQKKVESKRAIIGPGQKKQAVHKNNDDILGLDLLGTNTTPAQTNQNQSQNITFDQLLGKGSQFSNDLI